MCWAGRLSKEQASSFQWVRRCATSVGLTKGARPRGLGVGTPLLPFCSSGYGSRKGCRCPQISLRRYLTSLIADLLHHETYCPCSYPVAGSCSPCAYCPVLTRLAQHSRRRC